MTTINVDGRPFAIRDGLNTLQACLELGFDLPYFCWHPAMGSVGACRQCAVKQFRDENDTRGRLVMACMTPATDGLRVSIQDPDAREFRSSVIEWLMVNHPHDCPVCDEGGECHLQDMTVMTGHDYRRYRGLKRTFRNQDLGPFVNHEMNRCIQCYRCVRFYRDYADGQDLNAFLLRNIVYFGRQEDGVLESEFSGNLVEVCPTGVFDDKSLKQHYTRKWDLQTAPSVCVHCSVGCNTIPGERAGLLRRIRNRYNGAVNGYFLCDRGRYGYEFVNSERRVREPLVRDGSTGTLVPIAANEALSRVVNLLSQRQVIGVGSPRASLEANFALRSLVGAEHFFAGVSEPHWQLLAAARDTLRGSPARAASLGDVGDADAVLVLGEDVTNTAPMIGLALRQAVRNQPREHARTMHIPGWDDAGVREAVHGERGPLYVASVTATRLDDVATATLQVSPSEIARFAFAVAHALDGSLPDVAGLPESVATLAEQAAQALGAAKRPCVVAGISAGSAEILAAADAVARALSARSPEASLCLVVPDCNSIGLALLADQSVEAGLAALPANEPAVAIILENDAIPRVARLAEAVSNGLELVVVDHTSSKTTEAAAVVLPGATFAEGDGTLVNNEGRAQRFYQVITPKGAVQESWRWLRDLIVASGRQQAARWATLDDIVASLAAEVPALKPVADVTPAEGFRIAGQRVSRQPHRASGRTALTADISVHEPPPPDDVDTSLSFSMEGYEGTALPPSLIPRFWVPGWNSVQALNRFQEEIAGPLRGGDPGRRLIEPPESAAKPSWQVPPAFERRSDQWLLVPLHHIFGSEELSSMAEGVASLAPSPYVALSADDASRLRAGDGQMVEIAWGDERHRLPLHIQPIAAGVAGLPVLSDGPRLDAPTWATLTVVREGS